MTLERALDAWLVNLTNLNCYWLVRPEGADNTVVYRCISSGNIAGNLRNTGIKNDTYSLTVYHQNPDVGKQIAALIVDYLDGFNGALNNETADSYPIQLATFTGGFDQPLSNENGLTEYQFNRDFLINH